MVKKYFISFMLILCIFLLSACSNSSHSSEQTSEIPIVLSQAEYILAQNIFHNDYLDDYIGKKTEKEGIFAQIQDAFSNVTRYYVWGYLDQTMCCDWEWEFVPDEPDKLPPPGSKIKVSGTYQKTDAALDKLWINHAKVDTMITYTGDQVELNMSTMCDTLERVQLANMVRKADQFIGKQYIAYGRVASNSMLEDPYYDGSWSIPYQSSEEMPAIGTIVFLQGTYQEGVLSDARLLKTME